MSMTVKVGSLADQLDLWQYLRTQPGEGLDLFGQGQYLEPGFSDSPLDEGQGLITVAAKNREVVIPLALNAASKDALRTLVQGVVRRVRAPDAQLEWRDENSTTSTFFAIEFGRFEPEQNYFREKANWAQGTLRLQVYPYGSTGTQRIAATAIGTAPLQTAFMASGFLQGDVAALGKVTVGGGSAPAWLGDRVAMVADLPHPSYPLSIPAASLTGAILTGASGAYASQFQAASLAVSGESVGVVRATLQGASILAGKRHRVFALARGANPFMAFSAKDTVGQPLGPTAAATAMDWALVDLGILSVPSTPPPGLGINMKFGAPSSWSYQWQAGGVAYQPGISGLFMLPEDTLVSTVDRAGAQTLRADSNFFEGVQGTYIVGQVDKLGNTWSQAFFDGASAPILLSLGQLSAVAQQKQAFAFADTIDDLRIVSRFNGPTGGSICHPSTFLALRKVHMEGGVAAGVEARIQGGTLPYLAIAEAASPGLPLASLGLSPTAMAAGFLLTPNAELAMEVLDGKVTAMMRSVGTKSLVRSDGTLLPVASISASYGRSNPGRSEFCIGGGAGGGDCVLYSVTVEQGAGTHSWPRDANVFDSPGRLSYRQSSASVFQRITDMTRRGQLPRLSPSSVAVAVLSHPLHGGPANDVVSADVRVVERFTYAR